MDFKYGIGDRVVIIDTVPDGRYQDHCSFPGSMDQYCGVETTITSVRAPVNYGETRHEPRYSVSCDDNEWVWIESWLRPVESVPDFDADVTELL